MKQCIIDNWEVLFSGIGNFILELVFSKISEIKDFILNRKHVGSRRHS